MIVEVKQIYKLEDNKMARKLQETAILISESIKTNGIVFTGRFIKRVNEEVLDKIIPNSFVKILMATDDNVFIIETNYQKDGKVYFGINYTEENEKGYIELVEANKWKA